MLLIRIVVISCNILFLIFIGDNKSDNDDEDDDEDDEEDADRV